MSAKILLSLLLTLLLVPALPGLVLAQNKPAPDTTKDISQISSLGESLHNATRGPLHILYVHGIGAEGPGDSKKFQQGICARLPGCTIAKDPRKIIPVGRDYADSREFDVNVQPPNFKYLGNPIWTKQEEWRASAPFVDHYLLKGSVKGKDETVVVHEINWWPLVFPLKCRQIMKSEAWLAGPNKQLLTLCSQSKEDSLHPQRYESYPWITPDEATTLESMRARGALINRCLKTTLLDWGFSDAVMAVGSLHDLFREGMRQLFVESARFNADGTKTDEWVQRVNNPRQADPEFIVVSHSLGSYLVFSTLNLDEQDIVPQAMPTRLDIDDATVREDEAAEYILQHTSLVYFFANQVPLLELADVEGPTASNLIARRLQMWRALRQNFGDATRGPDALPVKPPQVIAWSDPSDLLTWCIPEAKPLTIVNLYVRNIWWHWLIANPGPAHENYASNKSVLRTIMSAEPSTAKGEVCK